MYNAKSVKLIIIAFDGVVQKCNESSQNTEA